MIGVDSSRSKALPAGTPSRISVITTSARPRSTTRCAVVEPTNPPPTTVTFFRIPSSFVKLTIRSGSSSRANSVSEGSLLAVVKSCAGKSSIRCDACLHVFDNGRREFGGAQFFGAFHQALEDISDAFLADGVFDGAFDELRRFLPPHVVKHHGAREHYRARVDDVFIGVFGGCAVRRLKDAVTIADVCARRHAQTADLRSRSV